MIVGISATRYGLSDRQLEWLATHMKQFSTTCVSDEFHHGDCIGGDAEAHEIALRLGYEVHIHPCTASDELKANCKGAVKVYEKLPPLVRNRVIVDTSDIMMICPNTNTEVLRSGTWSTFRYARNMNKAIVLIMPDQIGYYIKGFKL
jgi:hypothetical protein